MGFFDKLFKYIGPSDTAYQVKGISENDGQEDRLQAAAKLKNYIFQTYQNQNLDIELIRTQYLDNCLDILLRFIK